MKPTTFLMTRPDMPRRTRAALHDGEGCLSQVVLLDPAILRGPKLHYLVDNTLPPGASIGEHVHDGPGEEYYLILSGQGTMTLDGCARAVGPGDLAAVFQGGRHSLANTGREDLRMLVIAVAETVRE